MIDTFDEQRELKKLQDKVIRLEAEMLIMRQKMDNLMGICNKVSALEVKIEDMPSKVEVYEVINQLDQLYDMKRAFQQIKDVFN